MVILICGASHTGKTALAQRLLEKLKYPYLSIDHLKMGLIRSGNTSLTPTSNESVLTDYLWPIVREIIMTAIENGQNLIVEGCYIPFNWKESFTESYLQNIKYLCLIMSESYIRNHWVDVQNFANIIEQRLDSACSADDLIADNAAMLYAVRANGLPYALIDDCYDPEGIIKFIE